MVYIGTDGITWRKEELVGAGMYTTKETLDDRGCSNGLKSCEANVAPVGKIVTGMRFAKAREELVMAQEERVRLATVRRGTKTSPGVHAEATIASPNLLPSALSDFLA